MLLEVGSMVCLGLEAWQFTERAWKGFRGILGNGNYSLCDRKGSGDVGEGWWRREGEGREEW